MVLLSRSRKEGRESRIPTAEKQLQGGPGAAKAEGGVSPGGSGGSRIDPIIPAERARGEGQGEEEEEEDEEYEDFSDLPDTRSITSDDSFYPPQETDEDESELSDSEQQLSLFRACCTNNAAVVRALIRQGPQEEDVRETDRNKRTGLIVACYQGYVDIVIALAQCPHIDVNWQDNEGNTALITAAQAGHINITQYLLNYYSGLDIEKRNAFGFTALMKSAIQGRSECARALILAGLEQAGEKNEQRLQELVVESMNPFSGANINATDPGRGFTPLEWACFTGRIESAYLIQRLMDKPCAEQFCDQYLLEWPKLKELLAKATDSKTCLQKISATLRSMVDFRTVHGPEEDGVLDHMVRTTTSLRSSFVAIACRTVCPESPPAVGKRRPAVQEILKKQRAKELQILENREHFNSYRKLFQNSRITLLSKKKERRASLQHFNVPQVKVVVPRKASLLPLHLLRRSSVRPGLVIPRVRISKAPRPTFQPEKVRRKSNASDGTYLEIPKWRYKELKEQRKKAEEEKKRAEALQKTTSPSLQRKRSHIAVGIDK